MDDLKKLFEEVKAKNDKTKRLTRKEKKAEEERLKNAAIDAAIAEEEGGAGAEEAPKEEEASTHSNSHQLRIFWLTSLQNGWKKQLPLKNGMKRKMSLTRLVKLAKMSKSKMAILDQWLTS